MRRCFAILLLVWIVGCASPVERQVYWNTQRAYFRAEQQELRETYRKAFEKGFLEQWKGGQSNSHSISCTFGAGDEVTESQVASDEGYSDGRLAGARARLAYETEQLKKIELLEKQNH